MKKEIRKKLLRKRKELTTYEVLKKSNEVISNLKKIDEFKEAERIACYISFNNEVYTHGLIKEYINKKEVLVPFIDGEKKEIGLACIKSWRELEQGAYGILEPRREMLRKRGYSHIDVILIPGIAFDLRGYRIGYGKGYFDKFLTKVKGFKIGLAYDFQVLDELPVDEHDVKMDAIVTEKRIIRL